MTFLLGSTSQLTNVLSSSCLQSLLFSRVSLLISCVSTTPSHPFEDECRCKNGTQPLGGHAGSWQPSFFRVLASYQGCALESSLSTRTLWSTINLLAVVLVFTFVKMFDFVVLSLLLSTSTNVCYPCSLISKWNCQATGVTGDRVPFYKLISLHSCAPPPPIYTSFHPIIHPSINQSIHSSIHPVYLLANLCSNNIYCMLSYLCLYIRPPQGGHCKYMVLRTERHQLEINVLSVCLGVFLSCYWQRLAASCCHLTG